MRLWHLTVILILLAGILGGCGGGLSVSEGEQASSDQTLEASADTESYASAVLDTDYERALSASIQLGLGTFELKRTENAVTAEQAKTLLPLWQAIQRGSLQSDAETNAVLRQIEEAMTPEQLAAIAAMQLTRENLGAWMQGQGVAFDPPPGTDGNQNPFGNMSEEERAAMRATAQAGGGMPGRGSPLGNVSEGERAAMRATAEAGGVTFDSGRVPAGASSDQLAIVAAQVVELLTASAAE